MQKKRIELAPGKNIDIYGFTIVDYHIIRMRVDFVELKLTKDYNLDYYSLSVWLEENPGKTWEDYLKDALLTLYNLREAELLLIKEMER